MRIFLFLLSFHFLCQGLHAQQTVTFAVGTVSGEVNQTVCVPVSVADFQNLLSMQYTIQWDNRFLEFSGVQDFGLPWLSESNFGTQLAGEGKLTVVWIDNALQGVTRTDGQPIYNLCFKIKGGRGQSAYIGLTQQPTPYEVVNKQEKVLPLNAVSGAIQVK